MKKKLLIAVGAVLALGIVMTMAAGSVPFLRGGLAAAQEAVGAEGIEVVEAVQDPYAVISEAAVVPARHAALSLSASGIVAEVLVGEGESVEEGQVILRLRDAHQQAAVAQAEAGLESARAFAALATSHEVVRSFSADTKLTRFLPIC